jgi:hypothetical protein
MSDQWLIRAGRNGELVDEWKRLERATVGWDVGNLSNTDPGWDETKEQIVDEYDPNDPGRVTGRVRGFVGVRGDSSRNVKPGDDLVVLGDAKVVLVAEAGEYVYESSGLPRNQTHTYHRKLERIQEGPTELRELPSRFRQKGKNSLQLGSTLQRYLKGDRETVEDLRSLVAGSS